MSHILDGLAMYRIEGHAAEMRRHLRERDHARALDLAARTNHRERRPTPSPSPEPRTILSAEPRTATADASGGGRESCPPGIDCGSAALTRPA